MDYRDKVYEKYLSTKADQDQDYNLVKENDPITLFFDMVNQLDKDSNILELGCGNGSFLYSLLNHGFTHVKGVDCSPEQIHIAKTRSLPAELGDVFECLENSQGEYDCIIAIDFFEHFTLEELSKLFPLVRKALKPNGMIIIRLPNVAGFMGGNIAYGDITHKLALTPNSLMQILKNEQFEDLHFKEAFPKPNTLQRKVRWVLWQIIKNILRFAKKIESGSSIDILTENMICWARKK